MKDDHTDRLLDQIEDIVLPRLAEAFVRARAERGTLTELEIYEVLSEAFASAMPDAVRETFGADTAAALFDGKKSQ